jgi:hypothetical protein
VRLSWLARGMGEAQGKKVSPPPLRHRRSRRRRPLARSSHERPRGSRRSDSTEEKTWRKSSNPHKRPPSWGEGKETLAYRRAPLHVPTPATQRPHGGSCRIHRDAASVRSSAAATALWSRLGGDQRPAPSTTTLETTNGEGSALIGQRRQLMRRCHAGGNALSGVGRGAESTMRSQAVTATMIAPATATACRQPSAGMPTCARPSAA